ncbi:MAG TPA: hypothetical protein DCS93_11505 [Microscillaceae bacterium]|nr:hypothetical protein [Microscillaceae bacterium]
MYTRVIGWVFALLFFAACQNQQKETDNQSENTDTTKSTTTTTDQLPKPANEFIGNIEAAHNKAAFMQKKAVQFDFGLVFGGKEMMKAKLTLLTNSSKGMIEMANGQKIMFDQSKVFHSADMENTQGVRFNAYTWSYFFMFPFKLSDAGTQWNEYQTDSLSKKDGDSTSQKAYDVQKLTFAGSTGDSPEDWYIVYADKETHQLDVAAYIVTAGKTKEKAEADPHAIEYANYEKVDGIPVATQWIFWGWKADKGLTEKIGEAKISNVKFLDVEDSFFKAEGMKEMTK